MPIAGTTYRYKDKEELLAAALELSVAQYDTAELLTDAARGVTLRGIASDSPPSRDRI
ncbi:hypothetical protein [Nocardia pseudobrasiliensis]|uniref:Uncharacterized protein n=1 Tax=Nocardia pseudobrasiliensis TaxID=45979 RepID=A0A370I8A7_9NOCA|nr:hypothetical protein [Nocardia pseudobrasiliensis]RDI66942.1 hypothetical protein DFR76_10313 [Nocardia pseudobrasiliensis]